jgi:glycosyltransferase involved in cell wall biosynthesis
MTTQSILYVTGFFNVNNYRTTESLFDDFKPFLKSNLRILFFTDEETIPDEITKHPNITICKVDRNEIKSFQITTSKLPQYRNPEKDSLAFLQVMNSKPELLKRASQIEKADAYVWFDFGILKISKHYDAFISRMSRFAESLQVYPNKIIYPGCIEKERINFSNMFTFPIWRFCGGIIIVPATCLDEFVNMHSQQLEICKNMDCLTWEVNLYAAMESENPDLFQIYMADHNDTIVNAPLPEKEKKVILLSMIKNENKIIKRLIESTLPIADAICICDTGSTDNTVEVLTDYFKDFKIPAKVFNGPEHAWKNFGHNRSQSFLSVVEYCKELGWDPEHVYALVMDADMQLVVLPTFKKSDLKAIGYRIIQKSPNIEYYNSRFLKIAHPWICSGVTHEYWDGGATDAITQDKIYISDIGDGGCKADKFERDVRLLEQGLIDSPNNPRYLFYLAQSYKDSGQIDKAIEYYQKRINAGGWFEEVWYAMYTLMKLCAEKKDYPMMEMWGNRAYEYHKGRSENLLYLCRFFKDRRQYWKAWHYYTLGAEIKKPDDLLFIETDAYDRAFDYERCIMYDHLFPHKKHESIDYTVNYFNKFKDPSLYANLQWFVEKIPGKVRDLKFHDIGDYVATSTSMLRNVDGDGYRLNVRYVNYRIQPNGSYLMMENGKLDGGNPVRTDNYTCTMDVNFNITSPLRKMDVDAPSLRDCHIKGLEDVRIFYDKDGKLSYLGTSMEYSHDGSIQQVMGTYNVEKGKFENQRQLRAPTDTPCEKNWIVYKGNKIIYGWNPFRVCTINDEGRLAIETLQETPDFLSHMRGSSNLVEDGGYYYGIVHCVMYTAPRKYYHMVVKINGSNDHIVGYSHPFFFLNNAIEYVLGFEKQGETYTAIVSQNDRNPVMIQFENKDLHWRSI